jgi:penicillin amidase
MGPASVPATIYAVWREELSAAILANPLFEPLAAVGGKWDLQPNNTQSLAQRLRNVFYSLLVQRDTSVLPPGESWESVGARALAAATTWLAEKFGPDQSAWQWSRLHRTRPRHPLSDAFPEHAEVLDPPSVGVGGDGDTVQNGTYACPDARDYTITASSVTRYCFDLSDWDNSGWTSPLGASGHPGSPHYADQVTAWSEQRLYPMLYSWDRIEGDAETRQRLEPA